MVHEPYPPTGGLITTYGYDPAAELVTTTLPAANGKWGAARTIETAA